MTIQLLPDQTTITLPEAPFEILGVLITLEDSIPFALIPVEPLEWEAIKRVPPPSRPVYFTQRDCEIEIWPGPIGLALATVKYTVWKEE